MAAAAAKMSCAVVTPANSHEDDGDWLAQIESGVSISEADWQQLAQDRVSCGRASRLAHSTSIRVLSRDLAVPSDETVMYLLTNIFL